MINECIIAVAEEMCPGKVNLIKTVSMSASTVARRVESIAENVSSQLFDKNGQVEVDKSYEVHEELLDTYSIHGIVTGTDIFKGVEMAINQENLRRKILQMMKAITSVGKIKEWSLFCQRL
nr:unnamed protein product [Callosobruchus analis]